MRFARSLSVLVILSALSAAGCLSSFGKKPSTIDPADATTAGDRTAGDRSCADEGAALVERDTTIRSLREQAERRSVELLAERAEAAALRERLQDQKALLDEAIQEVVRARSKQRSVESRAQAATEIAEAEIALGGLPTAMRESAGAEQARTLLTGAGREFDSGNFGGALYLATQSKARIRLAAQQAPVAPSDQAASVDGETVFSAPMPLEAVRRSNVRRGPGTEYGVLRTIDAGTTLTGHAAKGVWIRATDADGADGWIHSSLVDGS